MAKPLDGIRVFDITLVGVGPWAGKLLAYLGADVIHVEAPGRVGELGGTEAALNSAGIIYANANNNKRSVMLDLKNAKDRDAAYRLLQTCDVFLENMRPGAMERLGLDYETISEINPGIVYLSASGYGQTGHMVERPAGDTTIQAFGGWTGITGYEGDEAEFLTCLHPPGLQHQPVHHPGDPDGPLRPLAHRPGTEDRCGDARRGDVAAEHSHRRVLRDRQDPAAAWQRREHDRTA